jgi:hypothetical protein
MAQIKREVETVAEFAKNSALPHSPELNSGEFSYSYIAAARS